MARDVRHEIGTRQRPKPSGELQELFGRAIFANCGVENFEQRRWTIQRKRKLTRQASGGIEQGIAGTD